MFLCSTVTLLHKIGFLKGLCFRIILVHNEGSEKHDLKRHSRLTDAGDPVVWVVFEWEFGGESEMCYICR